MVDSTELKFRILLTMVSCAIPSPFSAHISALAVQGRMFSNVKDFMVMNTSKIPLNKVEVSARVTVWDKQRHDWAHRFNRTNQLN